MNEQEHAGLLVRHWLNEDQLVLILGGFSEGSPPDLSEGVHEIAIEGLQPGQVDPEDLQKSQGDDFWVTLKRSSVVSPPISFRNASSQHPMSVS